MEKVVEVSICVCNECVMNGAMDIMESLEKFGELAEEIKERYDMEIVLTLTTEKCIGKCKHGEHSPRVSINGHIFDHADSQTVMEEIIHSMSKELN